MTITKKSRPSYRYLLLTGGLKFSAFSSIQFFRLTGRCTLVITMSVFCGCEASNLHPPETETDLCAALGLPRLRGLERRDSLRGHEFSDLVRDRLSNLVRLLLWLPFTHHELGCRDIRIFYRNSTWQMSARAFAVKGQKRRVHIRAGKHLCARPPTDFGQRRNQHPLAWRDCRYLPRRI